MAEMTPRELVFRAIQHEPAPRVPRELWALPWAERHYPAELAAIRRDFPADIIQPQMEQPRPACVQGDRHAVGTYVDEWGCVFENLQDGVIGEVKDPIVKSYASDLDKIRPPVELLGIDIDEINRQCGRTDRFVQGVWGIQLFERMQFLRGTENLFMDFIDRPAGLFELRDRIHEWNLKVVDLWMRTDVDAIAWPDDWGSQRALLMSPEVWRELLKPCYREYVERVRASGKLVMVHSDGHIFDIYEDLIEIGVHAVNSQLFCMDIEEVGRRFKGRLCFWGEIDRQHVLPFGSTDDVRRAVQRVANALYDGTGGVIAQCEFTAGAKPENVRTVFEEWDRISAEY
jgi:uroporphyrinogen-III decarboxylase